MELKLGLKVHDADNVATIFAEGIEKGVEIEVRDQGGHAQTLTVLDAIPYGHKVAIEDIPKDTLIKKYGEEIGIASHDIVKGEHVHVHNLDSMRGRGDLKGGKK